MRRAGIPDTCGYLLIRRSVGCRLLLHLHNAICLMLAKKERDYNQNAIDLSWPRIFDSPSGCGKLGKFTIVPLLIVQAYLLIEFPEDWPMGADKYMLLGKI